MRKEYESVNKTKETLIKSFDKLRTNGYWLIPFVVSLSNHEWNQLVQSFPKYSKGLLILSSNITI